MRKTALFLGRYQPPSIAHLDTILTILERWEKVVICIVQDTKPEKQMDPRWLRHIQESAGSFASERNPFTPKERKKMWQHAINEYNLRGRVICIPSPRPFHSQFTVLFPPEKTDIVYPEPHESDSATDRARYWIFEELLRREIFFVSPSFRLHNTAIKRLVRAGTHSWEYFIPRGAYTVFLEINGPERMKNVPKPTIPGSLRGFYRAIPETPAQ